MAFTECLVLCLGQYPNTSAFVDVKEKILSVFYSDFLHDFGNKSLFVLDQPISGLHKKYNFYQLTLNICK